MHNISVLLQLVGGILIEHFSFLLSIIYRYDDGSNCGLPLFCNIICVSSVAQTYCLERICGNDFWDSGFCWFQSIN